MTCWSAKFGRQQMSFLAAQEHIEVVRQDFRLIFKDIMDKDHFESKIYFRDPMTTNLNSFRGACYCLQVPCRRCRR